MSLEKRFQKGLEHIGPFLGQRCLVALSGGGDSVALLNLLSEVREDIGVEVFAARVSHGIRDRSIEQSENELCDTLCRSRGIPFHVLTLDPGQIDWQDYLGRRYLPYQLRQDPGPENSLGRIKFMLPNPFSVYLHDTPAKHLFNKPVRTFSSGCIRVEKPLALANYVLASQGYSEPPRIESIIDRGDTRIVPLSDPVPVYVLYHTAWVDGDARVHFREDIYRRDQKLAALLHLESAPEKGDQYAKKTTVDDILGRRPIDLSLLGDR